jgi:membrane peptidoglycan carboxypeptidase
VLDAYLNAVPFGRHADGIQAAAYAYFGKPAQQLTAEEAIVVAGQIGSSDNGADDPTTHGDVGKRRWDRVKGGLVDPLWALDPAAAARMVYPGTLLSPEAGARSIPDGRATGPRGHLVARLARELAAVPQFRGGLVDRGYAVVSTVDPAKQRALERYADETVAGSVLNAQPDNLQAAAVAVEPGTGRIVAYFGGHDGSGIDYAGATHPPGASFAVYPLAAALAAGTPGPRRSSPTGDSIR